MTTRRLLRGLAALGLCLAPASALAARVDEALLRSATLIVTLNDDNEATSIASGTLFGDDYYTNEGDRLILTNAHVILDDAGRPESSVAAAFVLDSREEPACPVPADIVAYDVDRDLAILQPVPTAISDCDTRKLLSSRDRRLTLVSFRNDGLLQSSIPDIGETLTVLGFPALGNDSITATQGVVGGYYYDDAGEIVALKTDAEASPGSSGGPVFDDGGQFVGIASFLTYDPDSASKINGVIAMPVISEWIDELVADGTLKKHTDSTGPCFTDIQGSPHQEAICQLKAEGIIGGYADGSFGADRTLNRAELAKLLVTGGLKASPSVEEYHDCFPDVGTEWFAPYVCYAREVGMLSGYPDGRFRPAGTVNIAEALKMVLGSLSVSPATVSSPPYEDVPVDAWFAPYAKRAKELKLFLIASSRLMPEAGIDRGALSEMLYRLLVIQRDNLAYYGQEEDGTYVDKEFGFSLSNPLDWEVAESDGVLVALVDRDNEAGVTVSVELLPEAMTAAEYWNEAEDLLKETFSSYEFVSEEKDSLGGREALQVRFTYAVEDIDTGAGELFESAVWIVVRGRRAYVIHSSAPEKSFSTLERQLERTVRTFAFTE